MATDWFYYKGEQAFGPVTSQQLSQLAADGVLQRTDLIWKDGLPAPLPANKVKGLFKETSIPAATIVKAATAETPLPLREWHYYHQGIQHGPVNQDALSKLVAAGKLLPSDLVWNEGLPDWIPLSNAPEIATFLPKSSAITPQSALSGASSLFKDILKEAKQSVKAKGWEPPPEVKALANVDSQNNLDSDQLSDAVDTEIPPRLPKDLRQEDVVAQCRVEYKGGHPNQIELDSGMLYLSKKGLFFVANDPSRDIDLPAEIVLDILIPAVGAHPKEMTDKAEALRSKAMMGKHIASFVGGMVGDLGGAAIRAAGNVAANSAAQKTNLGPPPKNRLSVMILVNRVKHRVIFDVAGFEKGEIEQKADTFWRNFAPVRSSYGPPTRQTGSNASSGQARNPVKSEGTQFSVLRKGSVIGPLSQPAIQDMLTKGELTENDLVRVEAWLPLHMIRALGGVSSIHATTVHDGKGTPLEQRSVGIAPSSSNNTNIKSLTPSGGAIAAGVAGALAGAAATAILTSGTAHASSPEILSSKSSAGDGPTTLLDTNQDGIADGIAADQNNDGKVDAVGLDRDGDGRIDTVAIDSDHDGTADAIGIDQDGDGQVDMVGVDTNGDGAVEGAGIDVDHDGQLDAYAADTDGDGEFDTYAVDDDHDRDADSYTQDYNEDVQIDDFDTGDYDV